MYSTFSYVQNAKKKKTEFKDFKRERIPERKATAARRGRREATSRARLGGMARRPLQQHIKNSFHLNYFYS